MPRQLPKQRSMSEHGAYSCFLAPSPTAITILMEHAVRSERLFGAADTLGIRLIDAANYVTLVYRAG